MTPTQEQIDAEMETANRLESLMQIPGAIGRDTVATALATARLEERERCAEVAIRTMWATKWGPWVADAIRKGD